MTISTKAILLAGSASTCPDIEYATGFRATDPVVVLQQGPSGYLVVPQMEYGRAARNKKGTTVVTPEMLGLQGQHKRRISKWAVKLVKRQQVKRVVVSSFFPHGIARELEKAGVRVSVSNDELFPSRAIKTTAEIAMIRQSQQAAVIAMRSAIALIAGAGINANEELEIKGRILTAEDLRKMIGRVLLDHDCVSNETIAACGLQAADPHERGSGPLKAHQAIVIDIFPQHQRHGYWGDLTRTVVKGRASATLKRMYNAVKAAQTAALSKVKAGVKVSSVHRCAVEEIAGRGFETKQVDGKGVGFIHSTGHGVGLAIHEAPAISTGDARLRSGQVITIEPGLYYPAVGGIRIEDTITVTPTGWRYLVPCEKKFEV